MLVEAALITYSSSAGHLVEGQFDVNRLIMRCAYLLIMGLLLGLAAEEEKQLRAESAFISRLAERVRSAEGSLSGAMQDVCSELLTLFQAHRALAPVVESSSGRVFVWDAQLLTSGHATVQLSEVPFERREDLLFSVPGNTWYASRQQAEHGTQIWQYSGVAADGHRLRGNFDFRPPLGVPALNGCDAILGSSVAFGESWHGRILILNPRLHGDTDVELRFLQNLLQQVAPAIYNLYLVRRLRSRAGAIERARAARELHDGAIQSLIAAEMQVDVLRRKSGAAAPALTPELERVQGILRQEVLALRELMVQMKPVDVGPRGLVDFLAETVERFRRDTGISARFVSELDEVPLPSRVCRELARIAQEALVNVRKHSGARNVSVLLQADSGRWRLVVEDDGRGFEFAGRLRGDALERNHRAPAVIGERVRAIGGELEVESNPGKGARL